MPSPTRPTCELGSGDLHRSNLRPVPRGLRRGSSRSWVGTRPTNRVAEDRGAGERIVVDPERVRAGFARWQRENKNGAAERTRTSDPRITNALLYHLSYRGMPSSGGNPHRDWIA